jgi:hypothetical protein
MKTPPHEALIRAIVAQLQEGLRQDEDVLHAVESTYGDSLPQAIAAVLLQRDSSDAATLAAMLLFPDADLRARIEPLALAARCSVLEARAVGEAVEEALFLADGSAAILLPGGQRLTLPLEPGDAAAYVERLQLADSPPEELSRLLRELFGPQEAALLSVMLRTSRLCWNPTREAVVDRLLTGLGKNAARDCGLGSLDRPAPDLLAWTLAWLDCLGLDSLEPDSPGVTAQQHEASKRVNTVLKASSQDAAKPVSRAGTKQGRSWSLPELLGARHLELTTQLRRAVDFNRAFSQSSFEVMMSQGVREPLMHPDAIREQLALLDGVCRILVGCPAWTLSGLTEVDLGEVDVESDGEGEAMIAALGGGRVPPGFGPF